MITCLPYNSCLLRYRYFNICWGICRLRIVRILTRAKQHKPCPGKTLVCFLQIQGACGGCGVRVVDATAKFEIRRGSFAFAVSPQVNGACSCSEGERSPVRETSRFNGREWGKGGYYCTAKTAGLWRCFSAQNRERQQQRKRQHH